MAFQNTIIGVGGVIVQYVINGFGMIFVAGFTAVMKLYGLLELAATSFGFSMATFTGQNLGAKKYARIREGMNSALKMSISTALVISAVILLFGKNIVRLFITGTPEEVTSVVNVSYNYLVIMGSLLFILYMLYMYRSALQGMGDTVIPMISGIVELFMRVGSVLILPALIGQYGVYFAEVIAWLGAELLLMATYYYRINRLLKPKPIVNSI
jgi:Na+-driven multidrug efflux pump